SSSGDALIAGDEAGRVRTIDPSSKAVVDEPLTNCGAIRGLQLDRNARRVFVNGAERAAAFELAPWKPVELQPQLVGQNAALAMLADGAHAAEAGADRRVRVWELEARGAATALDARVPDGAVVALGLEARLWAVALPSGGLEIRASSDGATTAVCKTSA